MTTSIRADLTLGSAAGLAISAVVWALLLSPEPLHVTDALLVALGACAGACATTLRARHRLHPTYVCVVLALLVSGPAVSCLTGCACSLTEHLCRKGGERGGTINGLAFRASRVTLASGLAAAGFVPLLDRVGTGAGWLGPLVPLAAHAAIFGCVWAMSVSLVHLAVVGRVRLSDVPRRMALALPALVAGGLVGLGASVAFADPDSQPLLLAAFAVLAILTVSRLHTARRQSDLAHTRAMAGVRLAVTRALVRTMEGRDPSTPDHLRRVHRLCISVARSLGLPEDEVEIIGAAAMLHDIGKIAIPESILAKPGRLTPEEALRVQRHSEIGAEIVQALPFRRSLAPLVRYHHERWDGRGYPDRLAGEEIPLGARILAAVDCYDALTSDRPYRKALSHREAAAFLEREAGVMFDPDVIDALLDNLECRDPGPTVAVHAGQLDEPDEGEPAPDVDSRRLGSLVAAQRELETLYDISRAMGYGLNLEEFFTLAGCRLGALVPHQSLVVYLLDESEGMLRAAFAMGKASDKLRLMTIPTGERLSGWAARQQRSVIGRDHVRPMDRDGSRSDLEEWADDPQVADLKSTLAAPLVAESGLVGVLTLYDRIDRGFTDDERRVLVRVAGYVARVAALEGEDATVARTSLTDPLTGVPNARFLWLESAHRMTRPDESFGLLAFRVGGLSGASDGNGNEAVDRSLCEVARRFAAGCRRSETLVRFGPDLFLVLTPIHEAGDLVRRWHELTRVIERPLVDPADGHALQLRSIAAHATYPDDGESLDVLLDVLDDRLSSGERRARTVVPFRVPESETSRSALRG